MAAKKDQDTQTEGTVEQELPEPRDTEIARGVNAQVGAVENPSAQKQSDQTSYPVPNDAEIVDPPLRSPKAPEDLAVSLAEGAGQHQPPDPDVFDAEGRYRGD